MIQRSLLNLICTACLASSAASGQSDAPQKHQPRTTVSHAAWTPYLQDNFSISPDDFKAFGLEFLTFEQELSLLNWIQNRDQRTKDALPKQDLSCGRPSTPFLGAKPEAYNNVQVYVNANGTAAEIISGVRERLRTMSGIQIVYSPDEADLEIQMVAAHRASGG